MRNVPELIVMLTYADLTVKNAAEIFEQCKNTKAKYWGFKEIPLPLDEMKELFGVKIEMISTDLDNKLYRIAVDTPFGPKKEEA